MLFETFTDVGRSNYDYFLVQFISEFYKSKEKTMKMDIRRCQFGGPF